jgi:hypothetical protein
VLKALATCLFGLAGFLTGGLEVAIVSVITVPCLWGIAWCMASPADGPDGFFEPAVGTGGARSASLSPR